MGCCGIIGEAGVVSNASTSIVVLSESSAVAYTLQVVDGLWQRQNNLLLTDASREKRVTMDQNRARRENLYRQASERIIFDTGVRDALDDEQAQQLLDWALARLRIASDATGSLSDARAQEAVDETAQMVRRVMRYLNRIVDRGGQGRDEMYVSILEFVEAFQEGEVQPLTAQQLATLEQLAVQGEDLSPETVFSRLMALLEGDQTAS